MPTGKIVKFSDFYNQEEPAYEIFDKVLSIVFDAGDGKTENLDRLSPEARRLYVIWCFNGEIFNGGFDQFFFNSAGNHAQDLKVYLSELNAELVSKLLNEACKWFPNGEPSTDRGERYKQLEKFMDDDSYQRHLSELDDAYYENQEYLYNVMDKFVRDNPDAKIQA